MRRVTIPGTDLEVSAIAYGTSDWGISPDTPVDRLYATYREAGGNCFDTAHCYAFWRDKLGASERTLGECIRAHDRRSDLILITKGGHPASEPQYPRPDKFLGPEVIESDVRESLERLGTDYIDLYFLHRDDPRAPVDEVMDALKPQVESGKLRYLGASHWSTARIGAANTYAAAHAMPPFVASQPGWTLAHPTPPAGPFGVKDRAWHQKSGLAVFAFSPTARGYFARGKDDQFDNPVSQARLARATKLGQELGATANQIAIAWLMHQPFTVVPILGTLKADHLSDALGAAAVTLSAEQVEWLEGDRSVMRILVTFTPAEGEKRILEDACKGHELLLARPSGGLGGVEVILGHPDPVEVMTAESVRWVHLTSAGYTPFDRDDLRQAFRSRGAALTNSSAVYSEPCAEHALMFMLAHARAFPMALANQLGQREWPQGSVRAKSSLLKDETVLIVGFGSIGRRLAEMLAPLTKNVQAVRRDVRGDEPVETRPIRELMEILPHTKHVVNTLPDNPSTHHLFDRLAFSRMTPGAVFYNIGRGGTVDQEALLDALRSGTLGAAYLDVCTPEPLPPDHPLWSTPNCHVTPHSAGGHAGESERLIRHFVDNLKRFERGAPLSDRVY